jgi:hypothetical protein
MGVSPKSCLFEAVWEKHKMQVTFPLQHGNAKAPQCYFMRILPILFDLLYCQYLTLYRVGGRINGEWSVARI